MNTLLTCQILCPFGSAEACSADPTFCTRREAVTNAPGGGACCAVPFTAADLHLSLLLCIMRPAACTASSHVAMPCPTTATIRCSPCCGKSSRCMLHVKLAACVWERLYSQHACRGVLSQLASVCRKVSWKQMVIWLTSAKASLQAAWKLFPDPSWSACRCSMRARKPSSSSLTGRWRLQLASRASRRTGAPKHAALPRTCLVAFCLPMASLVENACRFFHILPQSILQVIRALLITNSVIDVASRAVK